MNFDEAVAYLLGLGHETLSVKLGLSNVERLLDRLGRPHEAVPTAVQIAGTNGKGSTAAMLEAICVAANVRVGLYTSPHLISLTERVRIDGRDVTPEIFARLTEEVRRASAELAEQESIRPTFFEQVTAIALLAFREASVRVMILETGLGGRLDATTAANAAIAAVLPIDYDHQEYLGDSLAAIAAEKAAIIRRDLTRVAVVAPQTSAEAREVIERRLTQTGVPARTIDEKDYEITSVDSEGAATLRLRAAATSGGARQVYEGLRLNLRGRHQAINAAVAVNLAELLAENNLPIDEEAIRRGLRSARHRGRLEIVRRGDDARDYLFDGAHNRAGALALGDYLEEFAKNRRVAMIFAAMRDKDLKEIAHALFPKARRVVLCGMTNPRAADRALLESVARLTFPDGGSSNGGTGGDRRYIFAATPAEALRETRRRTRAGDIICVTGSLYLVGEVQRLMRAENRADGSDS